MTSPPPRSPRYQHGPSTPRPIRVNDVLWGEFAAWAAARGWTTSAAVRWLMEDAMVAGTNSVASHSETLQTMQTMQTKQTRHTRHKRAR